MRVSVFTLVLGGVLFLTGPVQAAEQKLLHVSFGFTKAFYAQYNKWFAEKWRKQTGNTVVIEQSHGPSGAQTDAVIQGKLEPDVLSLASPDDLDAIARRAQVVAEDWRAAFPSQSSPYSSTVVFLVRPGNPKGIKDWNDLALADRTVVTSDPQVCGGGRWNYVGAFGLGAKNATERAKRDYVSAFFKNAPVLYANQGEAGKAFLEAGNGDVLLTYESFALDLTQQANPSAQLVVPARSVEIELPVAVARKYTEQRKTTKLAEAYLRGLYEPEAQELLAKFYFRPRDAAIAAKTAYRFPNVTRVSSKDLGAVPSAADYFKPQTTQNVSTAK